MKTGLVMEGGAMRGMFTAGVTDVLMENNITFDGAVGTSAGAAFGCNYKSHQIGRVIRYNKKYCRDKRFVSIRSLIRTGNLFGVDFGYHQIPDFLDPFDKEAFKASPMEFYVVCTDVLTGKAVYHRCDTADVEEVEWMRASASMPLAATIVDINGQLLLDGGMTDSIPVKFFQSMGYKYNVVILTQPLYYIKKKNNMLPFFKIAYKKYPNLVRALETRHLMYNSTLEYIMAKEKEGELFVIRPQEDLGINHVCHNPDELVRVYQLGREKCRQEIENIDKFMCKAKKM